MICLVTDRHRLAERLARDRDSPQLLENLTNLVAAVSRAGIDLVQVREGDLPTGTLVDLVRRCVAVVADTPTRVVVNDRLDVALAAGAHGLHLKDAPIEIGRIRAAAPRGFLVGRSIHSVEHAHDVAADYLIFGTLFATRSKPDVEAAGLSGLAAAVRQARVPVLGIGGIGLEHLAGIAATGAAGIAAVDLFLPSGPDPATAMRDVVNRVRREFEVDRRPI